MLEFSDWKRFGIRGIHLGITHMYEAVRMSDTENGSGSKATPHLSDVTCRRHEGRVWLVRSLKK